jgi:hypothetical protein
VCASRIERSSLTVFLTYWKLNEQTPAGQQIQAAQTLMSSGLFPPKHANILQGSDCHNTDAWESEAAFNAFGTDRLGPAMGKLGINVMPEVTFYPAHEVYAHKPITLIS